MELLTDYQALEPLIKKNRSKKTYCARLTRWLDRLAHFDIKIKYIAGEHLALKYYLSKNPVSKPEPIENYDEAFVINCVILLHEFITTHGSMSESKRKEIRTDHSLEREQKTSQSQGDKQNQTNQSAKERQ